MIIALGAFFRLHRLGSMSYSNDELSALTRAQQPGVTDVLEKGVRGDGHPAGVELWLHFYTKILGTGELAVRLPFAICGIASILVLFLIGKRCFGETTGLLAAGMLAVLEFPILQSQLARPYAPGLLWVLLATLFLVSLAQAPKFNWVSATGWVVFSACALYTHHFSAFAVAVLGITGFLIVPARYRLRYALMGVGALLLYLPHLGITYAQVRLGGLDWIGPPPRTFLIDHLQYIFNDSGLLLWLVVLSTVASIIYWRRVIRWQRYHTLALLMFLAPAVAGMIWSHAVQPVLLHSGLLFTMPFALLLLFSFMREHAAGRWLAVSLPAIFVISLLSGRKFLSRPDPDQFRQVAEVGAQWFEERGGDSVLTIADVFGETYLKFYLNRSGTEMTFPIWKCCDHQSPEYADSVLRHTDKPYLLFLSPRGYADPRLVALMQQHYPRPVADSVIQGRGFVSLLARWPDSTASLVADSITGSDEFIGIAQISYEERFSGAPYLAMAEVRVDTVPKDAILCLQVIAGDQTSHWDQSAVMDGRRLSEGWYRVYVSGFLPETVSSQSDIKLFIWNSARHRFRIRAHDFVIFD